MSIERPVELRAGDADGDGLVGAIDAQLTSQAFALPLPLSPSRRADAAGNIVDFNGDGNVNGQDASLLASNFGVSGPRPWDLAVLFVSDRDGDPQIYAMGQWGDFQTRLTNGHPADSPEWLPGEGGVVYLRLLPAEDAYTPGPDIWMVNADGTDPREIMRGYRENDEGTVPPGSTPVLNMSRITVSSDGTRVAFTGTPFWCDGSGPCFPSARDLFIYDLFTGELQHVPSGGFALEPDWSPDGTLVAVSLVVPGEDANIWVYDVLTGTWTQVTATALADEQYPSWSPDGTRIAYVRAGDVWVANSDGTGEAALDTGLTGPTESVWSANGGHIFVEAEVPGSMDRAIWRIELASGGPATRMTDEGENNTAPSRRR